jgi:acyl-Coa thioesterase superfamily protein/acyl-CoA thioesterase superfamily protein
MSQSIFEPAGDGRFVPTEAALSPWTDQALHGSPSTMLMARAIERFESEQEMFVARLTVELLRPFGRVPVAVTTKVVRPGRKVQLIESSLWHGEQEVARATALRIRRSRVTVPESTDALPHPGPESLVEWSGGWRGGPAYHVLGVDMRAPRTGDAAPGWAWFRLKLPLVPDEEPSGLVRVCAAADFPNGISYVVDPRKTSFVNPDLTVSVLRDPIDEWVMVDARTWLEPQGTGLAEAALYDRRGRVGRSVQSLLVEERGQG